MDIKTLAIIMLIGHVISMGFMISVIGTQWDLFKKIISESVRNFRRVLFVLSILVLAGNLIPIIIDLLTLVIQLPRPLAVSPLSAFYAVSNAYLAAAAPAAAIWVLYLMAKRSHDR